MKKSRRMPPYLKILIIFISVITVATILLLLPFSHKLPLSIPDAIFLVCSAFSTTGLVSTAPLFLQFTPFGLVLMAFYLQLGAIAFITIAFFIMHLLGHKMGIATQFLIKEELNQNSMHGIQNLIKAILLTTFSIELLAFLLYLGVFIPRTDNIGSAFAISAFNAISAFGNGGMVIFDASLEAGLTSDWLYTLITVGVNILGSIGFVAIYDIFHRRNWKMLLVTTKLILIVSGCLLVLGTVLLKIGNPEYSWTQIIMLSGSTRSAGFTTFSLDTLSDFSLITLITLMFIGGGPVSTAGGVRITTFFLCLIASFCAVLGKEPNLFHRKVAQQSVNKAYVAVTLSLLFLFLLIVVVLILERNSPFSFRQIVFECVSAFSTTGYTLGITPQLHVASKLCLAVAMLVGRMGILTVAQSLNRNWLDNQKKIQYLEERIIIG
jgi:trk system potassium uptake protein TrkH